jgi:hypothetical protein
MKTLLMASAATLMLTACGGGGGGGGGEAPPATVDSLQGYWEGSVSGADLGGAEKVRAVVLSDGSAWLFQHDTSAPSEPLVGMTKASLTIAEDGFVGTGRRYPASGNTVGDVTISNGDRNGNAMLMSVNTAPAVVSTLTLDKDDRYAVAAAPADLIGGWHFTKENGSIEGTWYVDGNGTLTGTSSLGCRFGGRVAPHGAGVAVYDVTVTETCTAGVKQLTGIARLNSAKTFLTFGLTTNDAAQAEAFPAAKVM